MWILLLVILTPGLDDQSTQAELHQTREACEARLEALAKLRPENYRFPTAIVCAPIVRGATT